MGIPAPLPPGNHASRAAFEFEAHEMVPTQIHPALDLRVDIGTDGEHATAQVHMEDAASGTIRTVFKFSRSTRLKRFGHSLFRILFGGPSCHAGSGLPVADGLRAELRQDVAGLGGDADFLKTTGDVRYYHDLGGDIVGMVRGRADMSCPTATSRCPLWTASSAVRSSCAALRRTASARATSRPTPRRTISAAASSRPQPRNCSRRSPACR